MITRWDLNEMSHDDNDKNELMHHGVKGMRWGKHLPGVDALNAAIARVRAADTKQDRLKTHEGTITTKNAKIKKNRSKLKNGRPSPGIQATDANSIRAARRAYDNSLEGKVKKYANTALKSIRYNAKKAANSISSVLGSYGKKALSSLKIAVRGIPSKTKNFNKGATSSVMNPFKYATNSSYRKGYKVGNTFNKARRRVGIYTSSEKSAIRSANPRNRILSTKR